MESESEEHLYTCRKIRLSNVKVVSSLVLVYFNEVDIARIRGGV